MSYRSSYSLLKVWKRGLDLALANPTSSCSQILLTFPKSPLYFGQIPNPGEYRVPDFPSTATSTQIPNHDKIKKRCNRKQTTQYKQAKTEEVEINYEMFANRVFTHPGGNKNGEMLSGLVMRSVGVFHHEIKFIRIIFCLNTTIIFANYSGIDRFEKQ